MMAKKKSLVRLNTITNGAAPRGPSMDDDAHERTFSEIGPPQTVSVADRLVLLFDANGAPLTRKIGF